MAKEWGGTRSPFDGYQVRTDAFRDCIDAIKGAIAFGQQDANPPPEGHWLAEFWQIGRKLAASPADQGEDARDAARFRWLLDGNGFFMEEQALCCFPPCSDAEKNEARADIDAAMSASKDGA